MTAARCFGRAESGQPAAQPIDQLPCGMKVLAALMALKATRKTIKLRFQSEGSGAPCLIFRSIAIRRRPADPTWQSRWPKE
jgi:hypothetical protein